MRSVDPRARLEALEAVFAALAHAARRQILLTVHLRGRAMTAGEIAGRFAHAWPTTTRHLRVLEEAGLLHHERQGRTRVYTVDRARLRVVTDWIAWFGPVPREEDAEMTTKKTKTSTPAEELRAFALSLPGTREDFPWGELVVKVGKKVFVFLGRTDEKDWEKASPAKREHMGEPGGYGMSVKLPASAKKVLARPFAKPAEYGLGAKGWVSLSFGPRDKARMDEMKAWIVESYRAVAPKTLIKELDSRG